jgi:hypothetical protein
MLVLKLVNASSADTFEWSKMAVWITDRESSERAKESLVDARAVNDEEGHVSALCCCP